MLRFGGYLSGSNLLAALPYAATLVVLLMIGLGDSRKLNAPAMLAEPYKRGER